MKWIVAAIVLRWVWRILRAMGEFHWSCSEPDLYALDQNMSIIRGESPFGR